MIKGRLDFFYVDQIEGLNKARDFHIVRDPAHQMYRWMRQKDGVRGAFHHPKVLRVRDVILDSCKQLLELTVDPHLKSH